MDGTHLDEAFYFDSHTKKSDVMSLALSVTQNVWSTFLGVPIVVSVDIV